MTSVKYCWLNIYLQQNFMQEVIILQSVFYTFPCEDNNEGIKKKKSY